MKRNKNTKKLCWKRATANSKCYRCARAVRTVHKYDDIAGNTVHSGWCVARVAFIFQRRRMANGWTCWAARARDRCAIRSIGNLMHAPNYTSHAKNSFTCSIVECRFRRLPFTSAFCCCCGERVCAAQFLLIRKLFTRSALLLLFIWLLYLLTDPHHTTLPCSGPARWPGLHTACMRLTSVDRSMCRPIREYKWQWYGTVRSDKNLENTLLHRLLVWFGVRDGRCTRRNEKLSWIYLWTAKTTAKRKYSVSWTCRVSGIVCVRGERERRSPACCTWTHFSVFFRASRAVPLSAPDKWKWK